MSSRFVGRKKEPEKLILPVSFQERIKALLETSGLPKSSLIRAREDMTKRYRASQEKQDQAGFASPSEAIAYVAARLPATFSAVGAVLSYIPLKEVTSVLDLGAGPGTAALAAALRWPTCPRFHLIERDAFMGGISQSLLKDIPEIADQSFSFQQANFVTAPLDVPFDMVILSYALNELSPKDQAEVLKKAWDKAAKGIVIVAPGTPLAYQQLMVLRNQLIEMGAFITAPCPHQDACPLQPGDWCHFSVRLLRPSFHREIKGVSLPYEDEKFSYLIALREPISPSFVRVIRKPQQRSGHIMLDLCTSQGIQRQIVARKDKGRYKMAGRIKWGDAWDPSFQD